MKTDSVLSLLGFAAKAGKLSFGTHATDFAITSRKAKLVLVAEDVSVKTVKELRFKAQKQNIPVEILTDINSEALSHRVGKKCGVLAVCDSGFAGSLLKTLQGGKAL